MKYLVTGASGFIGRHLVAHLIEQGHAVAAASRSQNGNQGASVTTLVGTVTDSDTAAAWIRDEKPDAIIHLAAQSLPGVSWENPAGTFDVNVNGTMNLLTAIKQQELATRFVMVSSSSVYAPSKKGEPITEDGTLGGSSPYALSKLAAEQGALLYGQHNKIDVVCIRPFFIIGPGKVGDVSSDFARRIVAVEQGKADSITVGSLDVTRDFLDISDALLGIGVIVEKGESGHAYNLCSGNGTTIRQLLDTLKSLAKTGINERVDESLIRRIDEPIKVGDPARLSAMGWSPNISFRESMTNILNYWRNNA